MPSSNSVCVCGNKKQPRSKTCLECYVKNRAGQKRGRNGTPVPVFTCYEDARRAWNESIGKVHDRKVAFKRHKTKRREKILVIPDIHAPFHEPDMLAECLSEDADRAIVMGDLSDCYSLSRFVKYDPVSFNEEWAKVTLVLDEIATKFDRVDMIIGNHDVRLERALRVRLDVDQMEAIEYMTGGVLCPLTALAKHFPNVYIANHNIDGHEVQWFTTIGDAWFGHPEKFSKVPGSALRAVEEWLADNQRTLGIPECRAYFLAHTHQLGMFPWRGDKMLVEVGCLCKTQGYMMEPKVGGRPQKRGYVTFEQEDGVTDLNSIRMRWLDAE